MEVKILNECTNKECKVCGGTGSVIIDQCTTSIKAKCKCYSEVIGSPYEYIYPEWYPKEHQYQPEPQKAQYVTTL